MEKELFSPMQIDALGEMMNISLGSSATAVSNMLDHRVDITTPKVSVVPIDEFTIGNLEPAIGVEIKYVEGLDGSNIMLLRRSDVKVIVDILMGSETPDEEFELNDLTVSAVCEVMNQMMGAAATAMSDFLGFPVNISTPSSFELEDLPNFKAEHLPQGTETLVVVRFSLKIEDALESEFMNILSVELAKRILAGLGMGEEEEAAPEPAPAPAPAPAASGGDHKMTQEEIEAMLAGGAAAAPAPEPPAAPAASGGDHKMTQEEIEAMLAGGVAAAPAPAPAPAPAASGGDHKMTQEEIEAMLAGGAAAQTPPPPPQQPVMQQQPPMQQPVMQQPPVQQQVPPGMPEGAQPFANGYMGYPPMYYPYPYPPQPAAQVAPDPKVIPTQPVPMKELDALQSLGKEQAENLELIMEVPLQVTVEIGRTQRKVQDILEYTKGSLVVLDKLAGDQVDLFVNGKCIARGDVVVIDDNFGVRITEIVQKPALEALAKKS